MQENYSDIHKEIIENCKKGHRKAFYDIYKLYNKAMFNICYRMMNNKTEAEDMLQEAFSEAFSVIGSFRYESSFGAWLRRITINKCINELKRKKTQLILTEDYEPFEKIEENDSEKHEKIQYEAGRIIKAMELLPDGYRVIFSLYMLEGYDHTEIAQIMNISESTSKSQYMRAKQKIKELLINSQI